VGLYVVSGIDAGNTRPDDKNIEMLCGVRLRIDGGCSVAHKFIPLLIEQLIFQLPDGLSMLPGSGQLGSKALENGPPI